MEQRVSVLVTFYNQEKYVDQTLKSIINQKTDFDIKVLIGDDGSTDKTRDIVEKWMDRYPGKIELYVTERTPEEHVAAFRASRNRLNLLNHVNTEYFIFLDGDDYFTYEEKLQKQVAILDNPDNSDCIACGHNIDLLYPDGRRIPTTSARIKEGKYGPKEYWGSLYFHTNTLLARSSVIPTIDCKLLENNFSDNLITFMFIQQGYLYYIPESWAVYLQTGDGIWTGGKAVINHIRSMFTYDLCNQINPGMKKETTRKCSGAWMSLLKIRNRINASELKFLSEEAKDKNMTNAYNWIHYRELSLAGKQALCIKAFSICWKQITRGVLSKICRTLLKF